MPSADRPIISHTCQDNKFLYGFLVKNTVTILYEVIKNQAKELFAFKSIKAKLNEGDLKVENAELKKKLSLYEKILGDHGLLNFHEKGRNRHNNLE